MCIIFKTKISNVSLWRFIFWKTREITSQLFRVLESSSTFDINCWFLQKILLELEPQLCFNLLTEILACCSEFDCRIGYVDKYHRNHGTKKFIQRFISFLLFLNNQNNEDIQSPKIFFKGKVLCFLYLCVNILWIINESGSLWK